MRARSSIGLEQDGNQARRWLMRVTLRALDEFALPVDQALAIAASGMRFSKWPVIPRAVGLDSR
jgi:hypothetical protein